MREHVLGALVALTLVAAPAGAQDKVMQETLGKTYAEAEPQAKLVQIAVAAAEGRFKAALSRAAGLAIDELYLSHVTQGKTSKDKLQRLGELRAAVSEELKALNRTRREKNAKAAYVRFLEPDSSLQTALAMSYVADTAGPAPTLEALGCLRLVRETTSWFSHGALSLSYVSDALARDPGFSKADHEGKLEVLRALTKDAQAISKHERQHLDKAVIADWISVGLKGGKSVGDLSLGVSALRKQKLLSWATATWAQNALTQLAKLR